MPDAGSDVSFTVRLVNQVTAPARAIQASMKGVSKAVGDAKRAVEAPASKRGALSDWDKMAAKAKLSQASDFAKQNARLIRVQKQTEAHKKAMGARMDQYHADHGVSSVVAGAADSLGPMALAAVTAAAVAAAAAVGYLGYKFIETALEAGRFAESATQSIGYLTDNALHAGTVFDDVRHLAQKLGLDVENTVEGFQKLLAAQFTVGQAKGLIKMGADMRAIGASAEEVQRIIYAMSEIKSIGTLQKRQERMLQMAGISGQLIDQALMKRTGIKNKAGLDKARKSGAIDADTAILAIQDAVMSKTHEKALGDVGAARASSTINGLLDSAKAGVENFWIDTGQKMMPGATRIVALIAGTVGKLANDPKIAGLGEFLLAKWEKFTNWVVAIWPTVEATIIGGFHLIADVIEWVGNALTLSETKWDAIKGVLMLVGAAFAFAELAAFLLFLPLLLLIGIVGLVIFELGRLTTWVVDQAKKWYEGGRTMVQNLILGILSMMGPLGAAMSMIATIAIPAAPAHGAAPPAAVPIPGMQAPPTVLQPDFSTSSTLSALAGTGSGSKTEGGTPTTGNPVHIGELSVHVKSDSQDPQALAAQLGPAVRAELRKVLKTLS